MDIKSTIRLNNGVEIPRLGLGVYQSQNGAETTNAILWAFEAGYRHVDTAAIYGNEEGVGQAIAKCGIPRKELFITTKLWNEDMRRGSQFEAFNKSLKLLQTDYIDLYLIHWPVQRTIKNSWKALEELHRSGHIRAIGVSNFQEQHLDDLLTYAQVVPAVNQIECHPRLSQEPLNRYCKKHGIAVEAWSPLGGGGNTLVRDPLLTKIGEKYNKSAAQVMLRWDLQREIITIPKSVHQNRIIANADLYDFELGDDDMAQIFSMNKDHRFGADPDNFHF